MTNERNRRYRQEVLDLGDVDGNPYPEKRLEEEAGPLDRAVVEQAVRDVVVADTIADARTSGVYGDPDKEPDCEAESRMAADAEWLEEYLDSGMGDV